ncbi:MAG: DUF4351 domain-containing protein [Acidobacteriota bacterium]
MPISHFEMAAIERGLEKGFEQGVKEGRELGRKQDREEFLTGFVSRLLARRFGELSSRLQKQVQRLPASQQEELCEALFDFNQLKDLREWLDQHPPEKYFRPRMKAQTKKR